MLTAETKKNEDEIKRDQAQVEYATADSEYQIALTEYNEAVALRDATDPSDPNYAAYEADVAEKEAVLLEKQTIRNEKQAALTTANAEYNTSVAEYESAETRYNLAVEEGVSIDVEVAEAEYNAAEASYEAAHSQTNITRTSYESVDEQIEASYLYSDIDGYVLRLVAEEGEVSNPLVPALVIGSSDTVATIGISQNNIRKVKIGMDTRVLVGDLEFKGEVLSISKIPDQKSRTYETDISFPEDLFNFYIGESAVVEIIVGEQEGIWIPINIVQNDGQDYVYTIKDNRVIKKIITTSHIDNDYVMVNGLKIGDVLITNGMKGLKPGYLINIVGDANDE
jgi:RND family efflux transporter MFP subunit